MKVFASTDFAGHWPVGTAAVIVADTPEDAAALLESELARIGLSQRVEAGGMVEVPLSGPVAVILNNGDY